MLKEKLKNIFPDMKKGIERFPITVIFGIMYFIVSILDTEILYTKSNRGPLYNEFIEWQALILIGIPLVTVFEMIREKYFFKKGKWTIRGIYLLITMIFLLICKILYMKKINGDTLFFLELFGIGIISYLLFFLVPLIYRKKNREVYFQAVISNKITTGVFSIILFLGLAAIFGAVDILLFNIEDRFYYYIFLFSISIFGLSYFVSRLKDPEDNLVDYAVSKSGKFLLLYIIIPLIIGYTTILYIYGLKILYLLRIPQGKVSHLVVWYMIFTLFVLIILVPLKGENRLIDKFIRLFPIFSLPLLLLAAFSIFERISQYGVTESRYIIVMLIVWLLFNMLLSIFRIDVRRAIVSMLILIFISIFTPFNLLKISEWSQSRRFEKILTENGLLKDGKLVKNKNVSIKIKREIMSIINYFDYGGLSIGRDRKAINVGGKKYKDVNVLMSEMGLDDSWRYIPNLDNNSGRGIIRTVEGDSRNDSIYETNGYDYFIMVDLSFNANYSSRKYEIKSSKKNVIDIERKSDFKELAKINIEEEARKLYEKIKGRLKNENELKIVFPQEELSIIGENENIKYKISFITFDFDEKYNMSNYNFKFYFSEK